MGGRTGRGRRQRREQEGEIEDKGKKARNKIEETYTQIATK